jgi:hypothetical protein
MRFAAAGRTLARVLVAPPPPASRHACHLRPPLRAATLQRRAAHAAAAGMDAMEQYMFDLNGYIVVPQARPRGRTHATTANEAAGLRTRSFAAQRL